MPPDGGRDMVRPLGGRLVTTATKAEGSGGCTLEDTEPLLGVTTAEVDVA